MSQFVEVLVTATLAASTMSQLQAKKKRTPFKQCADCPWSADVAKRLAKKKVCMRHHAILEELNELHSSPPGPATA